MNPTVSQYPSFSSIVFLDLLEDGPDGNLSFSLSVLYLTSLCLIILGVHVCMRLQVYRNTTTEFTLIFVCFRADHPVLNNQ